MPRSWGCRIAMDNEYLRCCDRKSASKKQSRARQRAVESTIVLPLHRPARGQRAGAEMIEMGSIFFCSFCDAIGRHGDDRRLRRDSVNECVSCCAEAHGRHAPHAAQQQHHTFCTAAGGWQVCWSDAPHIERRDVVGRPRQGATEVSIN